MLDLFLTLIAPAVVVVVLMAALFLPKYRVGHTALPPAQALVGLAKALRFARLRVTETPDHLKVRLGSWTMVEVFATPWDQGARVSFRAGATTGAWTAIILLVIWLGAPLLALSALPLLLAIFFLDLRFVYGKLAPLLPTLTAPPAPGHADEIRAVLVQGLSEGHRLASEAFETEQSQYQDVQLAAVLAALVVWAVVFTWLFTSSPEADFGPRASGAAMVALAVAVVAGLALAYGFYRVFRARLRDLKAWSVRLYAALEAETADARPPSRESSAFELLADASRQVPAWIAINRDRFIQREPGSAIVLVALGFWAFWTIAVGAVLVWSSPLPGGAILLGGVGLATLAVLSYRRWKKALREEADHELTSWGRRLASLRDQADGFLREL